MVCYFMQIVWSQTIFFFWENKNIITLSSAELAQEVLKVKLV